MKDEMEVNNHADYEMSTERGTLWQSAYLTHARKYRAALISKDQQSRGRN